jgi:hypothetical protein
MNSDDLVALSRARFDYQTQKKLLREKYEAKMLFAHSGGMWRAGPELQTTLLTCPGADAVISDLYQVPIKVNTKELFALSQQRWQEQMSAWLVEHNELGNKR